VRRLVPALLTLTLLPASAGAQTPPPAAAPAKAKLTYRLNLVGHTSIPVAFTGSPFRVRGNLIPYVPGQKVRVRFFRNGKPIATKAVHVLAPSSGVAGKWVVNFHTRYPGRIVAAITHERTGKQAYAHVATPAVNVIGHTATYGQHTSTVKVMQRLLRAAGYVPSLGGTYDTRTGFAVLAFRKMSGLGRVTSVASQTMLRRLINGGGRFEVLFPHQGRHAEADLGHQVLALVDGAKVDRLYPISSGKPSTPTVLGTYRIYSRVPGYLPDGMYYSNFFTGGYAIHGYDPSPIYPASHGCLRTQIAQAIEIYDWLAMGDYVDTYYRSGRHLHPKPSPNAGP
jgi:hypothetical protein